EDGIRDFHVTGADVCSSDLQISRQKAQILSRLYRRLCQDNSFDAPGLQGFRSQCTCAITLTGSGGADTKGQCVMFDGGDVLLLGLVLGAEGLGRAGGRVRGFDLLGAGFNLDDVVVVSLLS